MVMGGRFKTECKVKETPVVRALLKGTFYGMVIIFVSVVVIVVVC